MDLEILYEHICKDIVDKNLGIVKTDTEYLIEKSNLNTILETVFTLSSKNEFSFSINRDNYDFCLITIFDKQTQTKKTLYLYYKQDRDELSYKLNYLKNRILKAITIIPLIGPDGAGKTTILTTLTNSLQQKYIVKVFKRINRRSIVFNLMYPINVYKLKKKGIKKGKNEISDQNPGMIILSGLTYYPYLIAITILQKKLIFVDRFFQDSLLENIRFLDKTILLRKNWKTLLKFVPKTFWHIQLDAKNELILSRKNELTYDDIYKYRELNFKIYLEKPAVVYSYVNTGNDIQNCIYSIKDCGEEIGILKKGDDES